MSVPIPSGAGFSFGTAQPLFDLSPYFAGSDRCIDISPDGKRFIAIRQGTASVRPSIVIVTHWLDEINIRS